MAANAGDDVTGRVDRVRLLHVAEDMSALAGGVPAVVRQLSHRLSAEGFSVEVLHAHGAADDLGASGDVVVTHCSPAGWRAPWGDSPAFSGVLDSRFGTSEQPLSVVHLHGVWTALQYRAAMTAYRQGVPSVFTAHGMLEPWLWEQQGWRVRWKKLVYWRLLASRALTKSSVVHAITPLERDHLHSLLPGRRLEIIPNAIDIGADHSLDLQELEPVIVFLGRLEPKKGVDLLIEAFIQAGLAGKWRLDIIGPSWSDQFLARLKQKVLNSNCAQRIRFLGPLMGAAKQAALVRAWVMAVPSHSEVIGLVNLEAASLQLPSITTDQTGLYDWAEGGGLLIQPKVEQLTRALKEATSWTEVERRARGDASIQLVRRRYSWDVVLPQWRALYQEIARA